MPQILRIYGFIFFFYSNDHEPIHIHVKGKGGKAKFDLLPETKMIEYTNLKKNDLKLIRGIVEEYREMFIDAWYEYFNK